VGGDFSTNATVALSGLTTFPVTINFVVPDSLVEDWGIDVLGTVVAENPSLTRPFFPIAALSESFTPPNPPTSTANFPLALAAPRLGSEVTNYSIYGRTDSSGVLSEVATSPITLTGETVDVSFLGPIRFINPTPLYGQQGVGLAPTLAWEPVEGGATIYRVHIADVPTQTSPGRAWDVYVNSSSLSLPALPDPFFHLAAISPYTFEVAAYRGQSSQTPLTVDRVGQLRTARETFAVDALSDTDMKDYLSAAAGARVASERREFQTIYGLVVRPPLTVLNVGEQQQFEALEARTGARRTVQWDAYPGDITPTGGLFTAPDFLRQGLEVISYVFAQDFTFSPALTGIAFIAVNRNHGLRVKNLLRYIGDESSYADDFAIDATRNLALISNQTINALVVCDLSANRVESLHPFDSTPGALAVNQSTGGVYVLTPDQQTILALDPLVAGPPALQGTTVQLYPDRIVLDEAGGRLLVSTSEATAASIEVFDAQNLQPVTVLTGFAAIKDMILDSAHRRLIVAEDTGTATNNLQLRAVDLDSLSVATPFDTFTATFNSLSLDSQRSLLLLNGNLNELGGTGFVLYDLNTLSRVRTAAGRLVSHLEYIPGTEFALAKAGVHYSADVNERINSLLLLDVSVNPSIIDELPLLSSANPRYHAASDSAFVIDYYRGFLVQVEAPTSPANWTRRETGPSAVVPQARHSFGFAWRATDGVLFGGRLDSDLLSSETFRLVSPSEWSVLASNPAPQAREGHVMGFDSARQQTVLFGGFDGINFLGDTWLLGSTGGWTQAVQTGPAPDVRAYAAMAYDSLRNRLVMFGGKNAAAILGDVWFYATDWQAAPPSSTVPSARHSHSMVYMPSIDRTIIFGGVDKDGQFLGDTWAYNADANSYSLVPSPVSPSPRFAASMTYDAQRDRIVLFGGFNSVQTPLDDTWEFDGTEWYPVPTGGTPAARAGHRLIFDATARQVCVFGGARGFALVPGSPRTLGAYNDLLALKYTPPRLVRAIFAPVGDTLRTDVRSSDQLQLTFTQEMRLSGPNPSESPFTLPVSGDSLGSGYSLSIPSFNLRQVNVTLGQSPILAPDAIFTNSLAAGSPSGIDVPAVTPSSRPLLSRFGVPPIDSGIVGVDDTALDVRRVLEPGQRVFSGTEGGTTGLPQTAGLAYKKHSIQIPSETFSAGQSWRIKMDPAVENTGVPNAFTTRAEQLSASSGLQQTSAPVVFSKPVRVTVEYQDSDFDPDLGHSESLLRIHRLVETSGTLRFLPVFDVTGAPQQQDTTSKTVSVYIDRLVGGQLGASGASLQQTGGMETFANIALDIVNENTANISPSPGASDQLSAGEVSLAPGPFSGYTRHTIQIPNYAQSSSGTGTRITIRTATPTERGSFPSQVNSVFTVTTQNAQTGQNVSFTDPVDLTIEYKVAGDPLFTSDLYDLKGTAVDESDMRVVRRNSSTGKFEIQNSATPGPTQHTLTLANVANLTTA
ncbi:MAG: kelch repeat-containing protein, partial [bacterium]